MSEEKAKYEPILDISDIKKKFDDAQKGESKPPEEEKQSPLSAKFLPTGVLEMRLDLKQAVVSEDVYHMFRGFFDNTRDKALALIMVQKEQYEESRNKILKLKESNGHQSFLNRLLKGK